MTGPELAAYAADAGILATYAATTRGGSVHWFHWANALGCLPIIATEVAVKAWAPLILTAVFGALGWYGVLSGSGRYGGAADEPDLPDMRRRGGEPREARRLPSGTGAP